MKHWSWQIHRIAIVFFACIQLKCLAIAGDDNLTCVITYKHWDDPERLEMNWSIPDMSSNHSELDINITRYMISMGNVDSCPEVSLTSCAWHKGLQVMSFEFNFKLFVTITEKKSNRTLYKKEWDVDPDNCKKPPAVGHVTAIAVNSTCVDVRWWYDSKAICWESYYRITFTPERETELTKSTTLKEGCNASRLFCNLSPYTKYVITVQAKFVNFQQEMTGHFSDNNGATLKTPEDVPVGAPEMVHGGFSLVKDECSNTNVRIIRLFWKDVAAEKKYGIITHFLLEIIPTSPTDHGKHSVNKSIDGSRFNSLVSLQCDIEYTVTLRAETSAGVSTVYSTTSIPSFGQDSKDVLQDVIPVISNNSFSVYWMVDTSITTHLSEESQVFWCLKNTQNHCLSPINWTKVSNNSTYVTVPVQHGLAPYKYLLGVSYDDRGIQWANCHYTEITDPRPPVGLKAESDMTLKEGSMSVYWDNEPCESRVPGPYIHRFVISFCEVTNRNEKTCTDALLKEVVSDRRNSYTLVNLNAGVMYRICIQAEGMTDTHSDPSCIYAQPSAHKSFWSQSVIAICVIIAILLLVCAIYGGIKCNVHIRRKVRTFIRERFRIVIPDSYKELETDTSSAINEYHTTV